MKRAVFPIAISVSLVACASPRGDYPDLAIRDGERMIGSAEPVEAEAPAPRQPLSTDVATRVGQLRDLGRSAHAEFGTLETRAARLVKAARGSPITTKANASAQIALAELQSAHEVTLSVLAELDVLLAEATISDAQLAAIADARGLVSDLSDQERDRIAALGAALPTQ